MTNRMEQLGQTREAYWASRKENQGLALERRVVKQLLKHVPEPIHADHNDERAYTLHWFYENCAWFPVRFFIEKITTFGLEDIFHKKTLWNHFRKQEDAVREHQLTSALAVVPDRGEPIVFHELSMKLFPGNEELIHARKDWKDGRFVICEPLTSFAARVFDGR